MNDLIREMFYAAFDSPVLSEQRDSAVLPAISRRVAFTTDSYVVSPLFFPGGDIGSLAVFGTVNDLAMSGARPLYMSLALVLEEGLSMEDLWRVTCSIAAAASACGVGIVTGDTKVVDRGKGDGIFVNTSGIGILDHNLEIGPRGVVPGDAILLSGDIGRHGIAILGARQGLEFESRIVSDSAPVFGAVSDLLNEGITVRCLRDPTRGGLAAALVEISETCGAGFAIDEQAVPVDAGVRGACEILGLDPLYVANEGRFVAFIAPDDAERALAVLRRHDPAAARIGAVLAAPQKRVLATNALGSSRIIDMLSGEQLPRIC